MHALHAIFFNNLTNYLYFYNKKCYCPCNEFVPPCTKQLRICKGKRELNRHYLERGLKESEREKCSKIVFDFVEYVEEFVALLILNSHYTIVYETYYTC